MFINAIVEFLNRRKTLGQNLAVAAVAAVDVVVNAKMKAWPTAAASCPSDNARACVHIFHAQPCPRSLISLSIVSNVRMYIMSRCIHFKSSAL
jgi:hypothetical protein